MINNDWTRRRFIRLAAGGSAGLALGFTAMGCSDDSDTSSTSTSDGSSGTTSLPARSGGTLRVAMVGGGTTDTMDPNNLSSAPDFARALCLWDPLNFRNYDWQVFGVLAESVEPDGTTDKWTIRLRDGIEFHHGKSMTADDVVFSFQRVLNPDSPGLAFSTLGAYLDPKNVTKIDDRTVSLQLNSPYSLLKQVLGITIPILPTDFDPAKPVGTGPWKYVDFAPGDRSTFARFENYWDGPALTDELQIINFTDSASASNAIQAGQVDIVVGIDLSQKATLEASGIKMLTTQLNAWTPFVMNTAAAPFDDVRVRQAFRLIVDREQMVKQVLSGYGRVGNDLYAPTDAAFAADLPQRTRDIAKAKELLAEAGYENLTLDVGSAEIDADVPAMVQVFAEQAKEAGVTINIKNMTVDQFWANEYMVAPLQPDYWENSSYMVVTGFSQIKDATYNSGFFDNPELTSLYQQVLAEADEAKQIELIRRMQEIQYESGNFIIWGFSDGFDALAPNVQGLVDNTKTVFNLNDYDLHRVWLG